tara:strand:- start:2443 stop:3336 length:894 start_codon:yes stop_codon:yes gene_type:complete
MSYLKLYQEGKLQEISRILSENMKNCTLCPQNCLVDRVGDNVGFCGADSKLRVSHLFLHQREEPEIVGKKGSGTIFFSYCNLGCVYCQNYNISNIGDGHDITVEVLAHNMIDLQEQGAENINLVTPTHYTAQIIEALVIAVKEGLNIPLVYNCGGYESLEIIKLLAGVFDIYMPDIKYSDDAVAQELSHVSDYWKIVRESTLEMYRQVGNLMVKDGLANRGLLIRHLVLPNKLAGSFKVLDFIKNEISPDCYVNIMNQYYPCHKAFSNEKISRNITINEYNEVIDYAKSIGLHRGFA